LKLLLRTRISPVSIDWHDHASRDHALKIEVFYQIFFGDSAPMSALVPTSQSYASSPAFDDSTLGQDDGQLQASVPPQLQSQDWLNIASLPRLAKRAVDLAGALVGLLLLTPVILLIALVIRIEGRGPILFRQLRRGYRGQLFRVIKFRTMSVDAEERLGTLEESNESAGGVLFKLRNDPRVTRLGQFLRRYSLDELPQLINVLYGEMSLVGPRPLQLRDSDKLLALNPKAYARRLEVMPGLTGPWQVGGRSEVDYKRMIELDVDYAENWSIGRDLRIIGKTFVVVLLKRGAY
jgi:lipopolysaccharide/colanic/teichoic acid biosynthesis glycosyltransferase